MDKIQHILKKLKNVRGGQGVYQALCPAHNDSKPSLSIKTTDDGKILLHCHAGCTAESIIEKLNLKISDLFPDGKTVSDKSISNIIGIYDYKDEQGNLLYQVCRTDDKNFFQRRPDENGDYIKGLGGINPVLYHLPEVICAIDAGESILIPEGEKDVDNLFKIGLTATTNPMGAGKWRDCYSDCLSGADVVILPDNDDPGKQHAEKVATDLLNHAGSIKVLSLPDLPEKGDISDWIDKGGTKEQLLNLIKITPLWKPGQEISNTASIESNAEDKSKPNQADMIVNMAREIAMLFHDETKDAFAKVKVNDHFEIWPTKSRQLKQFLTHLYYKSTGKAPGNEVINQAINTLEAEAIFTGPMYNLALRVAGQQDIFYYDLANPIWQIVKIEPGAWTVLNEAPILFKRYKNTASQVLPLKDGSIDLLQKYINLKHESDWILLKAYIVSAFVPDIPHPIPVFHGDKGSAKTTAQKILKKLIDPAHMVTMTLPTRKEELALTLMTNYSPCFDNLDNISAWQSDMLCQATTGGGISKRALYTDTDEVIYSFLRCPMLNGINNVVTRDDLLDRSILFQLERIDPLNRKEEAILWKDFEEDRPYLLGAIFDILAEALCIRSQIDLDRLPRMADFSRWGYAITEALGNSGEAFLHAYDINIAGATEEAIYADSVASAIIELMNNKNEWEGSMSELLAELSEMPGIDTKSKYWPKIAHTLSRRINKMKSSLNDVGIQVEKYRTDSARCIKLLKVETKVTLVPVASNINNHRTAVDGTKDVDISDRVIAESGDKTSYVRDDDALVTTDVLS